MHHSLEKSHPKQKCSQCDNTCYCLNWEIALAGEFPNMIIGGKGLSFVKNLKTGFLYECKTCKIMWYLDEDKEMIHTVPSEKCDLLKEWNRKPIVLNDTNINTLKQIGTTFLFGDRRHKGPFTVPCCVEMKNGTIIDFCIISFQLMPPINPGIPKELSADKILKIMPSEYAIPQNIRDIASCAPELQMGVSPTHILMRNGTELILSGTPNFLAYNEYKGCDIIHADHHVDFTKLPPIIQEDVNNITWFFADWSEDLFRLFGGQPR